MRSASLQTKLTTLGQQSAFSLSTEQPPEAAAVARLLLTCQLMLLDTLLRK
jgi:hypothetical protein